MTALDRRTLFRAAGVLGLGVGLSACGGGGSTPAPAESGAAARSVAHTYGSTEITGTPQRVVTVGLTEQDYVLALGLTPVGVRGWFGGTRARCGRGRPRPRTAPCRRCCRCCS